VAKNHASLSRPGDPGRVKVKNPGYWRRDAEIEAMQPAGERAARRHFRAPASSSRSTMRGAADALAEKTAPSSSACSRSTATTSLIGYARLASYAGRDPRCMSDRILLWAVVVFLGGVHAALIVGAHGGVLSSGSLAGDAAASTTASSSVAGALESLPGHS